MTREAPIIIIGMHRSGTSMVTRMLERLGLLVGDRKDENHEALFFLHLNEWLLRQSGAAWDHPEPFRQFLQHDDVRMVTARYLESVMKTPRAISFLGLRKYLRYHSPGRLAQPWGWKDPRNTYTLPLWLDLFPDAKVLHIYRHGVDVAESLRVREERIWAMMQKRYQNWKALYAVVQKRIGFVSSIRCRSLEGGFSLWERYLEEARTHVQHLGDRALEVQYEDFLERPNDVLHVISEFCGLPATNAAVKEVARLASANRAYSYRNDPSLQAFASCVDERLRAHGYEA